MIQFRQHTDSLDKCAQVSLVDRAALVEHVRQLTGLLDVSDERVKLFPYGGVDARLGWQRVYAVTVDGWGVVGFVDSQE